MKHSGRNGQARPKALLLSIRPEHAQRIFEGAKRYELRKVLPSTPFRRVFLYETGGSGIVGSFDVGKIIRKPIDELWATVGDAATSRERFYSYFASVPIGTAIEARNPVKFRNPVTTTELNGDYLLQPPQSFIILEPGQPLYTILEEQRRATLESVTPVVTLAPIKRQQRETYRRLVVRHIGANYADIDDTFPDSNLRIHDLGYDPAGFFTTGKEVLAINDSRRNCIGFTTLTYKSGGCLKTGPTILFPQYRRKGLGLATRNAIEVRARGSGVRKLYCTCPDVNLDTVRYLMSSGMRVEAHLERHYAVTHNELVFGKLLYFDGTAVPGRPIQSQRKGEIVPAKVFRRPQLIRDFRSMFENTWRAVSVDFARKLITQAVDLETAKQHEKPKRLVCLGSEGKCIAAAVLLPKRGGAVKGILLRSTNHTSSISKLLEAALTMAVGLRGRKVYFLHPVMDSTALGMLHRAGFHAEGVLRAPYVAGQDVMVMSRFL